MASWLAHSPSPAAAAERAPDSERKLSTAELMQVLTNNVHKLCVRRCDACWAGTVFV